MRSTGSSRGSQGNRGNRGGQGRPRGEDQRGQPEPTMSESSVGANRSGTHQPAAPLTSRPEDPMHLGNFLTAGPQPVGHLTSTTRNTSIAASPARAPSGVGSAIGGHHEQRPSHPVPSSHPSRPLPEPMEGLTSTTRNMSIASTPAQAPLGVGPGFGGHGEHREQYRGTLGHGPGLGPAQPLQHSQSGIGGYGEQHQRTLGSGSGPGPAQPLLQEKQDCYACQNSKNKSKSCDRTMPCSNCIDHNVPCFYQERGYQERVYQGQQGPSDMACHACIITRHPKICNREKPCSNCSKRNLRCVYQQPPDNAPGYFKTCDNCRAHRFFCDNKRPCSRCLKDEVNCLYSKDENGVIKSVREAEGKLETCDNCRKSKEKCDRKEICGTCIRKRRNCTYSESASGRTKQALEAGGRSVGSSQKEFFKKCNYCRANRKACNGKQPCSICKSTYNQGGANCKYDIKYRDQPTNSGGRINSDEIVPNVRIRRDDDSEDFVYIHAPTNIPRPEELAENMIIGWDRRRGAWVQRFGPSHGNLRGRRPGDIGLNPAGEYAHMIDEHEGGEELGGMRDMRTSALASRPLAQPQGFDVPGPSAPAHSAPGPSLAGRVHQRGSTESPPADDHHDLAKRQRRPPQN